MSREILGTKFSSSKDRCHGPMVHHECRNLPASYQRYLHSLQHSHHIPTASSIPRTPGRYDSRGGVPRKVQGTVQSVGTASQSRQLSAFSSQPPPQAQAHMGVISSGGIKEPSYFLFRLPSPVSRPGTPHALTHHLPSSYAFSHARLAFEDYKKSPCGD